jgi:hypothetical protein
MDMDVLDRIINEKKSRRRSARRSSYALNETIKLMNQQRFNFGVYLCSKN